MLSLRFIHNVFNTNGGSILFCIRHYSNNQKLVNGFISLVKRPHTSPESLLEELTVAYNTRQLAFTSSTSSFSDKNIGFISEGVCNIAIGSAVELIKVNIIYIIHYTISYNYHYSLSW